MHLMNDSVAMLGDLEQLLDPVLGPFGGLEIVLDEQLTEQEPDPDVGESPEGEQPARRGHEPIKLGVFRLDLGHDTADRLVDERDPELLGPRHGAKSKFLRSYSSRVVSAPVLLVRLRSEPEQAAVLFDIDGTLAPIVRRPEDAAVPDETRAELGRLTGRYGLVACVSGRTSADARALVGVDGIEYSGVHGLEGNPEAERFAPQLEAFAERIAWPWKLERKADVTLAFHYREAEDQQEAERLAGEVARAAEDAGLRPQQGRRIIEVGPPVDVDKGTAVRRLLADRPITRALFAGDDTTDLDAFRGLDEAGLDVALKVSVGSPEMNPALLTRADLVVDGPGELLALLKTL
jgi:trehalose 6-phosphate phosphatase